jgi:hypothetical protein
MFAFNNFQSANSNPADFGIGNFAQHFNCNNNYHTEDWTGVGGTLAKMAPDAYSVKTIEIWTKAAAHSTAVIPGTVSSEEMAQMNVALDATGEWAVVGDTPIFFTVASCTNVFTVAFDADVPSAEGTLLGVVVASADLASSAEIRARRDAGGLVFGSHDGTGKFTTDNFGGTSGGTTAVAAGLHRILVEYDHRKTAEPYAIRGVTISVDGTNVYHSAGLSYFGRVAPLFAIGGAAITNTPTVVLAGLKVKNLTFTGGLFKNQTTGEDSFATVNGTAAATPSENLKLVRLFGLTPESAEVTFAIGGIDPASGTLSMEVLPPVANGSLSVLAKESLSDQKWVRAKVFTGADAKGGVVSLVDGDLDDFRFFKLRAEEGVPAKGSTVDF